MNLLGTIQYLLPAASMFAGIRNMVCTCFERASYVQEVDTNLVWCCSRSAWPRDNYNHTNLTDLDLESCWRQRSIFEPTLTDCLMDYYLGCYVSSHYGVRRTTCEHGWTIIPDRRYLWLNCQIIWFGFYRINSTPPSSHKINFCIRITSWKLLFSFRTVVSIISHFPDIAAYCGVHWFKTNSPTAVYHIARIIVLHHHVAH